MPCENRWRSTDALVRRLGGAEMREGALQKISKTPVLLVGQAERVGMDPNVPSICSLDPDCGGKSQSEKGNESFPQPGALEVAYRGR